MSIFIDSASIGEIGEALKLGYVTGVTTNPLLMAKEKGNWRDILREICNIVEGPVYYQLDRLNKRQLIDTVKSIHCISPEQIVVKIPAVHPYYEVVRDICRDIPCCVTAVYSVAQVFAAAEAGAKEIAVYVNRISRFFSDGRDGLKANGPATVCSMRELIDAQSLPIKILAASLKSADELVDALKSGAHNVTTSLSVLKELGENPLSDEANSAFESVL